MGGVSANYANSATYGGAIYATGGVININNGFMQYNRADCGGGIYSANGTINFSNGYIRYNFAQTCGGGMFIGKDGTLYLKGNATLDRNYVPASTREIPCSGGGVYLEGTLVVGENVANPDDLGILTVRDNFSANTNDPVSYSPTRETRNNVFLPEPVAHQDESDDHTGVITVIQNGISINSKVGFSVPSNHVPVIYCKRSENPSSTDGSWTYLDEYTTGPSHEFQSVLFDDTEHYISVHYTNWPDAFDPDHVYLFGFWPESVQTEPENFSLDNIDSPEDLAWLITLVNGRVDMLDLPNLPPHSMVDTTVTLTADLDMSKFGWVPIGISNPDSDEAQPFCGTFNGNGHTITGMEIMEYKTQYGYGLFGNVDGGTVENVFVKDAVFYIGDNPNLIVGALSAELENGATVCNSEVSATINTISPDIIVGGAVGRLGHNSPATLHSVCAMVDMTGGRMGGLVGELESGSLYNSFANPKFTYLGGNRYFGALVGVNKGTVENCYARMQGSVPTENDAANYFGWLAGQNASGGHIDYCYLKVNENYFADNSGSAKGYGYYADDTQAPYLYARRDNQVTVASGANSYLPKNDDKQMLYVLNNWVKKNSNATTTYTSWARPTTKVINNDLPVLRMPSVDAVACTGDGSDGEEEVFLNYRAINDLLVGENAFKDPTQAIWLYASKEGLVSNENSDAKLYIDENVSVIPADRANGVINAYVGITIANVAGADGANSTFGNPDEIDWHMFSTPLQAAPLGINYSDNTQYPFSYSHPSGMPYYLFYEEGNANHGYFPSHRYGTDYPTSNSDLASQPGNYYYEWDFYTYYEPEYHWINFKRNNNSHWHENAHDVQIHYYPDGNTQSGTEGNETYLLPGRGYLVAFADSATYMQCHGELNKGANISVAATTLGYYSKGYNFLGNPYQACLDFDAFAQYNTGEGDTKLWSDINQASYIILDETSKKYVAYAYGSSENPFGAGRYIHPHQGFMLYNEFSASAVANFVDNNDVHMRAINDTVRYRGAERPAYPLVNLFASEANGNESMVTVELGRPEKGGAKLMADLHVSRGQLWCHYDDVDYALAFTQPGVSELPIRFKTTEEAEYTMTWSTHNGDFSYLHLIDNITGVNVDCLSQNSYKFSSKPDDFTSRFRLVFDYTGIEEPMTPAEDQTSFAFMMGDELVVNGEGTLHMFDISGRLLASKELHGPQSSVSLPQVSAGIYVLRLNTADGTKIQKIVVGQ
jgi:hypothetical protein